MPVTVVAPKGVFFDLGKFGHAIENALDMAAENIRIDFQVTVRTWMEQPKFEVVNRAFGERWIGTDSKIYKFISHGTKIRYATMTPNFRAKTKVDVIASYAGRGGVAFISRNHPRPGIEARNFDTIIGEKWQKRFPELLQTAINVEARIVGK